MIFTENRKRIIYEHIYGLISRTDNADLTELSKIYSKNLSINDLLTIRNFLVQYMHWFFVVQDEKRAEEKLYQILAEFRMSLEFNTIPLSSKEVIRYLEPAYTRLYDKYNFDV